MITTDTILSHFHECKDGLQKCIVSDVSWPTYVGELDEYCNGQKSNKYLQFQNIIYVIMIMYGCKKI